MPDSPSKTGRGSKGISIAKSTGNHSQNVEMGADVANTRCGFFLAADDVLTRERKHCGACSQRRLGNHK